MPELILTGALLGLGATVAMDLWALVLNRVAGVPMANWAAVGRWVWHLRGGVVFHDDIAAVPPVSGELRLGWIFHYAVGAVYGIAFLLIVGAGWLASPTLLPAWIFSILTIAAGWFLLQPGLGLGWAASRTDAPWKVRGLGLAAHTVFGLGLWAMALVL
jgi:hypothetical protein